MNHARTLSGLMNHIVETHHAFCRRGTAQLGSLFKEAAKHGKDFPQLKRMEALFAAMAKDLRMHLVKEEQTLFPYIARVEQTDVEKSPVSWPAFGTVENPIRVMVEEHVQTDHELSEIRRLTGGYTPPSGAPGPVIALYEGLRAFDRDMSEHIHAEDRLLFPRAVAMEQEACSGRTGA